jgi:hypothetical protein
MAVLFSVTFLGVLGIIEVRLFSLRTGEYAFMQLCASQCQSTHYSVLHRLNELSLLHVEHR